MTAPGRSRRAASVMEALLVTGALVVAVVGTRAMEPDVGERVVDTAALVLAAAAAAALALRRLSPFAMLGSVGLVLAVYAVADYPSGPVFVTGPVALLLFGLARPRRQAYVAAAATVVLLAGARLVGTPPSWRDLLVLLGWAGAAVLAADAVRGRWERAVASAQHREDLTARAVAQERLRIAQDLHDTVAHAMVSINVQAGVAAHLAADQESAVTGALRAIRTTSAAALTELNAIVGVLRDGELGPPAGLDGIEDLVAGVAATGTTATLERQGAPDIEPAVGAAAYRVVQEALTNALRHVPGARVSVLLRALPASPPASRSGLHVEVRDDGGPAAAARPIGGGRSGPPARSSGGGAGLISMRERVQATGGDLVTGPRPDGGFAVQATWPAR